jgi:hypothetical protein
LRSAAFLSQDGGGGSRADGFKPIIRTIELVLGAEGKGHLWRSR